MVVAAGCSGFGFGSGSGLKGLGLGDDVYMSFSLVGANRPLVCDLAIIRIFNIGFGGVVPLGVLVRKSPKNNHF